MIAVAAMLVGAVVVFVNSSDSRVSIDSAMRERDRLIAQCEADAESAPEDFGGDPADCEGFFPREGFDPRFRLAELQEVLRGLSFLIVILAMGLGATFMGAEWGAGTMTTILTWEPRRLRVFSAKVLGGIAFVFVAVMVGQWLLVGLLAPVAVLRGSTEGVDAGWLVETLEVAARSALVASIAAVIGMAIASAARNTGAALIVAFVYFAVIENLMRGFRPNWARWLVGDSMALFVIGSEEAGNAPISELRALVTIIVYAALFFLASATLFRSRDVT
jgi:ABC-2 type transport system permease protein